METKILVVDDDPTNAQVLATALRKAGHTVFETDNGFDAVALAAREHPDLILLDMMMPRRDGLETCSILKSTESTASIPVIFVTAAADTDRVVKAFAVGGCDYVTKPLRLKEILARVSVHLQLHKEKKDLLGEKQEAEHTARQLATLNHELDQYARLDSLTQILNRRAWEESARMEHDRSRRCDTTYSIAMIDVDFFKSFNDTQGHPAGDECLRRVANAIASACRKFDLVGRYGGEEFIVLAPDTGYDHAAILGERIRTAIWQLAIDHPRSPAGRVTASVGVAVNEDKSFQQVVSAADSAMYRAKDGGRNLVCVDRAPHKQLALASRRAQVPPQQNIGQGRDRPVVLVVDDNATSRALCRGQLEKESCRVVEAHNGVAALDMVRQQAPDVILMDVMMPDMDGLECTRRLKGDPDTRDIPIIMLSTCANSSDILAGLEAGADEYLTKPYYTSELTIRVRSMIRLVRERKNILRSYQLRAEQIRILTLLLEFCRSVGCTDKLDDILRLSISAVSEVAKSRRISIMLPNVETRRLHIAVAVGIDKEMQRSMTVPFGKGIAGRVFTSNQPIILNSDDTADFNQNDCDASFFMGVPLISTPLCSGGETVAVLNVAERLEGCSFEQREIEYIELITGIAGSAIHSCQSRHARDEARDLIMTALARLAEHRDNDTAKHVDRVTRITQLLAEGIRTHPDFREQVDSEFLRSLARVVPLHDIGKVAIPDSILRKPGKLTIDEMTTMRSHTTIGASTLQPILHRVPGIPFLKMAIEIIQSHHERFDGSGYPDGLAGDDIPLAARLTAVADVYDALSTRRVYKEAYSHDKSVSIIAESSGTQFDPRIVEVFLEHEREIAALAQELADGAAPSSRNSASVASQESAK